jgi:hypothetical protein
VGVLTTVGVVVVGGAAGDGVLLGTGGVIAGVVTVCATVTVRVTVTVGCATGAATVCGANPRTKDSGAEASPIRSPATFCTDQVRAAATAMPSNASVSQRAVARVIIALLLAG